LSYNESAVGKGVATFLEREGQIREVHVRIIFLKLD
jgi:hypothetical protein